MIGLKVLLSVYKVSHHMTVLESQVSNFFRTGNDASTSSKSNGQPSRELQARFVRSMHELDLLGLLKQTGRKKDHVIRSIVDLAT
jgi:hypothetical protein